MDLIAVRKATDGELQALGIVRRGDILALKAFAEKGGGQNVERNEKKRTLLEVRRKKEHFKDDKERTREIAS